MTGKWPRLILVMAVAGGLWSCAIKKTTVRPPTPSKRPSPLVTLEAAFLPLDPRARNLTALLNTLRETFGGLLTIHTFEVQEDSTSHRFTGPHGTVDVEELPILWIQDHRYEGPFGVEPLKAVVNQAIRAVDPAHARTDIPACYTDFDFSRKGYQGKCVHPGTPQARFDWQPAPRIRLTVLTDRTNPLLNIRPALAQLKHQYPGLTETVLDFQDPSAQPWRPLLQQPFPLPLFLLDQRVEATPSFKEMQARGWLVPVTPSTPQGLSRSYVLHPGLLSDVMAFPHRLPQAKTLDVFIMSQCPFGAQASLTLLDARKRRLIPPDTTFHWHYIADRATTPAAGFTSMHGPEEVAEDLRQLIIQTRFPAQFLTYLDKRFGELAQAPWQQAALASHLEPTAIEELVRTDGANLLTADIQLTHSLNVHASPTFLWENQLLIRDLRQLTKLPPFQRLEINPTSGSCRK
ncbi:MAG: hypothetical protein HYZ73_00935 [Elusimicrobia bacterium]|nr:hypothetical protein [Elusimicrobiota bacterium]